MQNRIAAPVAAALAVAVLGACTSRPQTQLSSTASVSVNGNDANIHVVKCSQLEWYRTIDIGGDFAGATVVIDEHAQPLFAESVRIQNLGGFTGMYSKDDGGEANMSFSGDKFTITGTANGHKADKPGEPATADFQNHRDVLILVAFPAPGPLCGGLRWAQEENNILVNQEGGFHGSVVASGRRPVSNLRRG